MIMHEIGDPDEADACDGASMLEPLADLSVQVYWCEMGFHTGARWASTIIARAESGEPKAELSIDDDDRL